MQNSKLIKLLRSLDKEALKTFDKFLQSPYHNSSPKVLIFFRLIRKYSKSNFTSTRLDKEKVFTKLYPKAPTYQDSNIRNLMTLLYQQLEAFLFQEKVQKETAFLKKILGQSEDGSEFSEF